MAEFIFDHWLKVNCASVRTPMYIYGESCIQESLAGIKELFPNNVRIFYSLKANPQPGIVQCLSNLGVGGEIASIGEYRMCKIAGVPVENILVGGVAKSSDYLASMCDNGNAGIVVESVAEWRRLQTILSPSRQAQVLLRVNPGVSLGGLDMAGESQFGLDIERAIAVATECQANPNVEFFGLHFYFGSQRLSPNPIIKMVLVAGEVLEIFLKANLKVNVVDLGLGCGIPYLEKDAKLDMKELATKLYPLWESPVWSSVHLWTEAGRVLVGRSGFYMARVQERKEIRDKIFIFLDGGINTHNPGLGVGRFFRNNPHFFFYRNGQKISDNSEIVDIVGNLCTSADVLGHKVSAPVLEEGDLVVIPNAGAYCQTTGLWGFNSQPLFLEAIITQNEALRYLEPQYTIRLRDSDVVDSI